jgi:hypothetical protein
MGISAFELADLEVVFLVGIVEGIKTKEMLVIKGKVYVSWSLHRLLT